MMAFYTARTVGERKKDLTAFQAGGCWLYADSLETIRNKVREDCRIIVDVLEHFPITQFSFLMVQCKEKDGLAYYEREYIRYVADVACTEGLAVKLACRALDGKVYTSYAAASRNVELAESIQDLVAFLDRQHIVRVKDASLRLFGDVKGSFIWAKTLLEHLAYLSLVGFNDQWSVSA